MSPPCPTPQGFCIALDCPKRGKESTEMRWHKLLSGQTSRAAERGFFVVDTLLQQADHGTTIEVTLCNSCNMQACRALQ